MIKKYALHLYLCIGSALSIMQIQTTYADASCTTICPTCPQKFLKFCRMCKYQDGILKAECQDAQKPAAFVTTSCPVILNAYTASKIDTLNGKLQCPVSQDQMASPSTSNPK